MGEHVFKTIDSKLELVGDFDGLYESEEDPWGQSAGERSEYIHLRTRQLELIKTSLIEKPTILDVGCGLGYTTQTFSESFYSEGADISKVAIEKARLKYPELNFHVMNILSNQLSNKRYSVIVLNNLLWYIIHDIANALKNSVRLLQEYDLEQHSQSPFILLSNFMLSAKKQQYAREHFEGVFEAPKWLGLVAGNCNLELTSFEATLVKEDLYEFHAVLERRG